jgi:fructan beta-fructosidase
MMIVSYILVTPLFIFSLTSGQQFDKFRPQLHYSVEKNWLNDPNGLVYLNGEYHLYYQYHPGSSLPGPKSWAHAISQDLTHWTDLPVAIEPDELGDIWSGSAVVDFTNSSGFQLNPDIPPILAIFTQSGQSQQQSIAYSNDFGRTFTKFRDNPVIPNPGRI